ncbi:MAG: hypothetical protein ACYC5K_09915, partial [Saccharofermentanales bacterium]
MKFQWTGIKVITLIAFSTLMLSSCDGGNPSITVGPSGINGVSGNSTISEGATSMNSINPSESISSGIVNTGFNLNSKAAFSLDNPSGVPDFTYEEIRNQ